MSVAVLIKTPVLQMCEVGADSITVREPIVEEKENNAAGRADSTWVDGPRP